MTLRHRPNADKSDKNAVYYPEMDKDTDEPTGRFIFKFRAKNRISKKTGDLWDRRPAQYDSNGVMLAKPLNLWGGTKMRVFYELYLGTTKTGVKYVSLQPSAVKIYEAVLGTGSGPQVDPSLLADDDDDDEFEGQGFSAADASVADDDDDDQIDATNSDDGEDEDY